MIYDIFNSQNGQKIAAANGTEEFSLRQSSTESAFLKNGNSQEGKGYELSLSDEGWSVLGDGSKQDEKQSDASKATDKNDENGEKERDLSGREKLSEDDQRKVDKLKQIDRKVHTHEQAHLSAAGGYARGGAHYEYVSGPDGKRYANAGHVNIDTSPEKDPQATIRKMAIVRKAALAPADPSPADRQIAATAVKQSQDAQKQLAQENMQVQGSGAAVNGIGETSSKNGAGEKTKV